MKGWGYWDYINAGMNVPQPFDENWYDYQQAKSADWMNYWKSSKKKYRVTQAQPVSVTRCAVCDKAMNKRGDAKTCSPKCRKALSRKKV